MKKLLSVVAVLLIASMAMAQNPGFDFLGSDPIEVEEGGTVDIYIQSIGGHSAGMTLVLQAIGGFEILDITATDFEGAYAVLDDTATYEEITIASPYAIAQVGWPANVELPDGLLLAKATISAGSLLEGATGSLTTDADAQTSSLAAVPPSTMTVQDTVGLLVVPEPMTALLLLGGLPLLRRRRA